MNSKNHPVTLTFIVLAYNHSRYIRQALESVEHQTLAIDQLVISDDASSDDTKSQIADFISRSRIPSITYIDTSKNIGLIASLKKTLAAANGDIVFIQAGDDFSHPDRARVTRDYFSRHPSLNMLYSSFEMIDENGKPIRTVVREGFFSDPAPFVRRGSLLPPYGTAFRQMLVAGLLQMGDDLQNEDDYIGMYGVTHGGLRLIPEITYFYRVHSQSISGWVLLDNDDRLYVKKYLANSARVAALKNWRQLLASQPGVGSGPIPERLDQKISLNLFYQNLESARWWSRLAALFRWRAVLNLQDVILLLLGPPGVLLLRKLRRLKYKLSG